MTFVFLHSDLFERCETNLLYFFQDSDSEESDDEEEEKEEKANNADNSESDESTSKKSSTGKDFELVDKTDTDDIQDD